VSQLPLSTPTTPDSPPCRVGEGGRGNEYEKGESGVSDGAREGSSLVARCVGGEIVANIVCIVFCIIY